MEQVALEFESFPARCEWEILELSLGSDAAGETLPQVSIGPANLVRAEAAIVGRIAERERTDWRDDLPGDGVVVQGKGTTQRLH